MRLVFAGTPEFAAAALSALLDAGHHIALVLTQPDRPRGRGLHTDPGAVKLLAVARGLPVFQPVALKDALVQQRIADARPEAMVVAAYGLLLPQAVLGLAPYGALNIHASLLPRWRGAAPVQRAILAGDTQTGVSIMQMDAGLDTGAVLLREQVSISDEDTAGTLLAKLTDCGARLIVRALPEMARSTLQAMPQPDEGITYAAKIDKGEALLDWREPAPMLWRKVRAFNPAPGASTRRNGGDVKIWRAAPCEGGGHPGVVLAIERDGISVACGEGALRLLEMQRAGGRRLPAVEFARGTALSVGDAFENAKH